MQEITCAALSQSCDLLMLTMPVSGPAMVFQRSSLPVPALGTVIQLYITVLAFLSHLAGTERAL